MYCSQSQQSEDVASVLSKTLYTNGSIITMEGEAPEYAEVIMVEDGLISFVGKNINAIIALLKE